MISKLCFALLLVSLVNANVLYDLSKEDYNRVKDSRNFTGKVVLVTGSNSGIGEGIVKLFSVLGAQVVVTGRNASEVNRVAKEVQELSPNKLKPLEVVGDVTKSEDLERLVNQTIKTYGKLDVLVNNAGIGFFGLIEDSNFMSSFDLIFNTNLRSAAELNHLSVPYLQKTNGSIIHISSIAALAPHADNLVYAMAKKAMDMMTRCMAIELGPSGVRVNTINPGTILTKAFADSKIPLIVKIKETAIKETPLRRMGDVLDVAKGVVFLSSSDASFITGANLVIDGGLMYNFFIN